MANDRFRSPRISKPVTDDIGFAKNTLFGLKNGSIFPATRKTSPKIH